jgi:hypothetical protein
MNAFTRQYIETMLWAETDNADDSGGAPLDDNYTAKDISPEALKRIEADCAAFQEQAGGLIAGRESDAGHDFWLTRRGHGAGFWDGDWPEADGETLTELSKRLGHVDVYVGDDNRLYLA